MLLLLFFFLATGPWDVSKLWRGDVPTLHPPDLGSVANCYIYILIINTPHFLSAAQCSPGGGYPLVPLPSIPPPRVPTQDHLPTRSSPVSIPAYQVPSLPSSDSATSLHPLPSPRLPDSQWCALSATEISYNITISCFRASVSLHHGSHHLPPPS